MIRLWGPYSAYGMIAALLALAIDQAHKYWTIEIYRLAERGVVEVTSFFDLKMTWNRGISYGLLEQDSAGGRYALIAVSLIAVVLIFMWISHSTNRLAAISLGMITGGALGNIIDRIIHGAVADFFAFHYGGFSWYIFNIADVAICAGVAGLLLDWLISKPEKT